MYSLVDRKAELLADGRIAHEARVVVPGVRADYDWRCVCTPEADHDHDALHELVAKRLVIREHAIDDIVALEGVSERVGLVKYEITDSNIQIHAPAKWRLYVSWKESPLTHPDEFTRRTISEDYECPSQIPDVLAVLGRVRGAVKDSGMRIAKGLRAVGEFFA